MNWSTRIVLLYSGFVVMMLALVFGASSQDFHLVTEDYYAEELDYQEKIFATQNAKALASPLLIEQEMANKEIHLSFPTSQTDIVGEVSFYKPDNAKEDKTVVLKPTSGQQTLSLAGMRHGRWMMKVQWESGEKMFYQEEGIFIP